MENKEIESKLEKIIYDNRGTVSSYVSPSSKEIILIELVYCEIGETINNETLVEVQKQDDGMSYRKDFATNNILMKYITKKRTYFKDNKERYFIEFDDIEEEKLVNEYESIVSQKYFSKNLNEYVNVIGHFEKSIGSYLILLNNDFLRQAIKEEMYEFKFICLYDNIDINIREFIVLDLDKGKIKNNISNSVKLYKVLNLRTLKIEDIEESNYNDDIRLATCYFRFEAIEILKKYVNIYGIGAVYKDISNDNEFDIDIINNKYIGISEGDFNSNITEKLKKLLKEYNIIKEFEPPYMSRAMYEKDIEAKFNDSGLSYTPEQKVGELLYKKYGNLLLEKDIFGYYSEADFENFKSDMGKLFDSEKIENIQSFDKLQSYILEELK